MTVCTSTLATLALIMLAGCHGADAGVLPTEAGAPPQPELTLVWVGRGQTERLVDGTWQRAPSFDYEFTVEQRRYADHWESVKHLRRRHPDYDGSAGPREQTMYFRLDLGGVAGDVVPVAIASSLGRGDGHADPDFRTAALRLHADVPRAAPFDTYRIDQHYDYEHGVLTETVALDEGDAPWVRNHEAAVLFAPHAFAEPPTRQPRPTALPLSQAAR